MKIELLNRIGLIIMIILLQISFLITAMFLLNFVYDSKDINLDEFNITRMSINYSFDLCQYFECKKKDSNGQTYLIIFNIIMLILLLFQGIFLVSKSFRAILLKNCYKWQIYYCIFLQKILFHFMLIMSMMLFQPIKLFDYDLSNNIRKIWFNLLSLIGFIMMGLTLKYHLIVNDVLAINMLFKLITGNDINPPDEQLFGRDKIYHISRNPFRGGLFLVLCFVNSNWNVGKIIYLGMFIFFMYVECANEEIYYFKKFEQYRWYVNSINNRFFGFSIKKLVVTNKKV